MKNFGWIAGSWATALLLGLPVLALIFSALSADGDLFRHLVDTVLLDYLRNTSGLVLGVVLLTARLSRLPVLTRGARGLQVLGGLLFVVLAVRLAGSRLASPG